MKSAMAPHRLQRVLRARGFEPATGPGAGQSHLQGRQDPTVSMDQKKQRATHGWLSFPGSGSPFDPKPGLAQTSTQVTFHHGQRFSDNRRPRHKNQAGRPGNLVLVEPKGFADQSPNPGAYHRPANPPTRHKPQANLGPGARSMPIQQKPTTGPTLSFFFQSGELPGAAQPLRAPESKSTPLAMRRHDLRPASDACGPRFGDCGSRRARRGWTCAHGSLAGVCAGFSKVDIGVSYFEIG